MITWTLTSSGYRTFSGAATDQHEALAEALDAILDLYDLHDLHDLYDLHTSLAILDLDAPSDTPAALPVCTVQLADRDPIIIRDIAVADPEQGRRALAAHLTQTLTDLTGDPFAMLPSAAIGETA